MEAQGWNVEKTHGNQYQEGFPDLYLMHPKYSPRWVECKVVRNGDIHFTTAQMKKFPKWIANGVGIWLVCGTDLRGAAGLPALKREYAKLFNDPNLAFFLNPQSRRILLR